MDSASFFGEDSVIVEETSSLENAENRARLTRSDGVRAA